MTGMRRSGRIPRQIPILLLGTDTSGRVFSEETRTLVLSRHGAGILSRNKFAPDEVLTLRVLETGREAEIRLVGNLGEGPGGANVYGVAFCGAPLDFWQMEFPPPEPHANCGTDLECSFCASRTTVEQSEVEADVFLVSESVFRYCDSCGQTTPWKLATGPPAKPKSVLSRIADPQPDLASALASGVSTSSNPAPVAALVSAPSYVPALASAAPERSTYSGSIVDEVVSASFIPGHPAATAVASPAATAVQAPPASKAKPASPPTFSGGGKPNRRRHVRTRVQFTACVRLNRSNEEVVECDNVSKGGLCFRSRKRYQENAAIEVAVPYSPGQPAIFVPAQIRRVEELPGLALFRYGAAYI